jgi:hypothetical protein
MCPATAPSSNSSSSLVPFDPRDPDDEGTETAARKSRNGKALPAETDAAHDPALRLPDPSHALPDPSNANLSPDRERALTHFLARIREAGVPEPELHANGGGGLDLLWREHKLVVRIEDVMDRESRNGGCRGG